ncbi:COX15/CtaA family protein [Aestuariimicrobium sp. T2.26MG-19.2B]|uniref:COX15/CtaA family protein n=1 Tax=Aestuariimicrobium sp. T2.26MG-19.2B TaxID=3040679 RepID=UPI002477C664|nr:COX15/CtaA family protein [Aestuariimicrobium sp. T2.26MG-19.2B]CAI9399163.1 Heme A synthase [Aestuariimicrobium sp. T2.26MG-19.2B]
MDFLNRLLGTEVALRRWSWASLVANIGIIVTGAIVRLTASGLGCSTWPQCNDAAYVPHGAISHHSLIEFGNRLLTFVLIIIAVACWITARRVTVDDPRGRLVRRLTLLVALGIPFQGVIGGVTVLSGLNPFVVALHLLLSLVLVVLIVRLLFAVTAEVPDTVGRLDRTLGVATFALMMVACWLGTVVTGSGPHAGDGGAARTGFDIEVVARIHSATVWLTVLLTVTVLVRAWRAGHRVVRRWATALVGVELVQAGIGYLQFFTGLPAGVVLLHLLGAGLAAAAAASVMYSSRHDSRLTRAAA